MVNAEDWAKACGNSEGWRSFLGGDLKNGLMEEIALCGISKDKYNSFFIKNQLKYYLFLSIKRRLTKK